MNAPRFRVWDTLRREFLSAGQVIIAINAGRNPTNDLYLDILDKPNKYDVVNRFIFMMATGFLDRNGREMWEGDVLRHIDPWGRDNVNHIIGKITFGSSSYSSNCHGAPEQTGYKGWLVQTPYASVQPLHGDSCIEIAGNIYENQGLMKQP